MPPKLSSATTLKRIQREVADIKKEDLGPIILAPSEDNIFVWRGSISGPEGSIYEGGVFEFEVHLAPDYPFSAPKVMFKTRIYHMNISEQGNICIDILKHNWSPTLSLFKVILSLSSLLTDPNPKDPLVPSIAHQYTRNRKLHDSTARQWTERYARPKPLPEPVPVLSLKAEGKQKAQNVPPAPHNAPGSSRGSPNSASREPITIDDSDSDEIISTRSIGTGKRKRATATDAVELVEGGNLPHAKKIATGAVGSSRERLPVRQHRDVIVIEDD